MWGLKWLQEIQEFYDNGTLECGDCESYERVGVLLAYAKELRVNGAAFVKWLRSAFPPDKPPAGQAHADLLWETINRDEPPEVE